MILLYYSLLLIFQPMSLQFNFNYIIEFKEVKSPDKKDCGFEFGNRVFQTYNFMTDYFKKKFSFIPTNNLFLTSEPYIYEMYRLGKRGEQLYSSINNPTYNPINHVPSSINVIKILYQYGHVIYVCNKSKYGYLLQAKDYIIDLHKYGNNLPKNLDLKGDPMAQKIWRNTWNGCNYNCFSQDSYFYLKKFLLEELNELRRTMKLPKLECYQEMEQYADQNYNLINYVDKNSARNLIKNPFQKNIAYTEPQLAFTVVNFWYYQISTLKKSMKLNIKFRRHIQLLSVLFTKTTTKACFGAVKTGEKMLVTCVFN